MDRDTLLEGLGTAKADKVFIRACYGDGLPVPQNHETGDCLKMFLSIYAGYLMGKEVGALGL